MNYVRFDAVYTSWFEKEIKLRICLRKCRTRELAMLTQGGAKSTDSVYGSSGKRHLTDDNAQGL